MAGELAFQLQMVLASDPRRRDEAAAIMERHGIDDLDVMGMMQVADMPGGKGVATALHAVGDSIDDRASYFADAWKLLKLDEASPYGTGAKLRLANIQVEGEQASAHGVADKGQEIDLFFTTIDGGWRLTLPGLDGREFPKQALPSRANRDRRASDEEQARRKREKAIDPRTADFQSARLRGIARGQYEIVRTGKLPSIIVGDGNIAQVFLRFDESGLALYLPDLKERDLPAYYLQTKVKAGETNLSSNYTVYRRSGTNLIFQNGSLAYYATDSPFVYFAKAKDGPFYHLPLSDSGAEEVFGSLLQVEYD